MRKNYDVIVIGGGPGGYVAAIRAAQLGLKTACVEEKALGGTCLNVGCIPSKALLVSSEKYADAKDHFDGHGVEIKGLQLNLKKMMAHKQKVIDDNVKGIGFLLKKNKVSHYEGKGAFLDPHKIRVTHGRTEEILEAKHIIIATGSEVMPLPGIVIDEESIVSSTGALEFKEVPKKLIVIGAGVIGLELGSVWNRLGAEVQVIEYQNHILPGMDAELCKTAHQLFAKQGLTFMLGKKVIGAKKIGRSIEVTIEDVASGVQEKCQADKLLVAIGRRAYTTGLNLKAVGLAVNERGQIETTNKLASAQHSHIFAIGDVTLGPMLAHKAEEEGVAVTEHIAGQSGHVNYDVIPGVVYTAPEIASIGKTEEELKAASVPYKVGKFPFSANGRARAMGTSDGFAKLLACSKTDRLLGAHIIGSDAGHLIAELAVGMEFSAAAEDIARTCHAHPTLSEVIKEAALAVDKRAIHS